jgi:hypothetical protein
MDLGPYGQVPCRIHVNHARCELNQITFPTTTRGKMPHDINAHLALTIDHELDLEPVCSRCQWQSAVCSCMQI